MHSFSRTLRRHRRLAAIRVRRVSRMSLRPATRLPDMSELILYGQG